jgi:hypothetical protein
VAKMAVYAIINATAVQNKSNLYHSELFNNILAAHTILDGRYIEYLLLEELITN